VAVLIFVSWPLIIFYVITI